MKTKLLFILALVGCSTTSVKSLDSKLITKFQVGDCTYLVEPATGKGNTKDLMKVDSITETHYTYRWWIYWTNSWALDTNTKTHNKYESMAKKRNCP